MTIDVPSSAPAARRQDIQGLRGVSALLVMVFHIWTARTAGAVDVFFVVSGYLLLGSLIRQHTETGAVDLHRYGVGILRRLLPTALIVLLATVAVGQLLVPETRWDRVIREAFATAVFLENYALIHYASDYLARDDAATPFASGWAISTQVQAYILMAALMALAAALRASPSRRRQVSLVVLGSATVASFAYAVWLVSVNQPAAYFSTWARLWEFTGGGLAAWVLHARRLPSRWAPAASWAGLAMLVSTGWLLGLTRLFPGWASVWPAAGALLILAGGMDGSLRGAARFLAWRPIAWLGGVSYGVYLWHSPVVAFALILTQSARLGVAEGLAAMALSVALAAATKAWLEPPLVRLFQRERPIWRPWVIAALTVLTGVGAVGLWRAHQVLLVERAPVPDAVGWLGAAAGPEAPLDPDRPVVPRPIIARRDVPVTYALGCHVGDGDSTVRACAFGPEDAPVTVALVGSSHAAHWLPALQEVSARRGWRIVSYTKSSCLFAETKTYSFGVLAPDCEQWNVALVARLAKDRPDLVVTVGTYAGGPQEVVVAGAVKQWDRLGSAGVPMLILRDTPWYPFDAADCVDLNGPTSARCARVRPPDFPAPPDLPANALFVDPLDWFCTRDLCPPVIGNVLVYRDRDHVTTTYARTLGPLLEPWIDRALSR